jgi:hypothetical protein
MTVRAAEISHERPVSGFRVIFDLAWERLKHAKLLYYWEIIAWSFFAAYLGADIFGFYNASNDLAIAKYCFWTIVILTPLLIFIWVYRVHVYRIPSDETVRTIPITPSTFIFARMTAVGLMWLRVFLPLIVIAVHFYDISSGVYPASDRWKGVASGLLLWLYPGYPFDPTDFSYSFTLILWALQSVGWVILPITWGFFLGMAFRKMKYLYYFLHLVYLAAIPSFWHWGRFLLMRYVARHLNAGTSASISSHDSLFALFAGIGWILPAWLLFRGACQQMGRRRR